MLTEDEISELESWLSLAPGETRTGEYPWTFYNLLKDWRELTARVAELTAELSESREISLTALAKLNSAEHRIASFEAENKLRERLTGEHVQLAKALIDLDRISSENDTLRAERDATRKALSNAAELAEELGNHVHLEHSNAECDFSDKTGEIISEAIRIMAAALSARKE